MTFRPWPWIGPSLLLVGFIGSGLLTGACGSSSTAATGAGSATSDLPTSASKLDTNDLSVLYPLPRGAAEADALLGPSSAGRGGELLPEDAFVTELQNLSLEHPSRESLRVLALRLDPCFPRLDDDPSRCQAMIRLVMQPLEQRDGGYVATDAAVHLFYTFDRSELARVVGELAAVKDASSTSTAGPLAVNPAIAAEGPSGAYAAALRKVVLAHCGAENLTRITFTQLSGQANVWIWGGFERKDGKLTPLAIGGTASTTQRLVDNAFGSGMDLMVNGSIEPALDDRDRALGPMLDGDRQKTAPAASLQGVMDAALFMENPQKITADEGTCVSCHVATTFRAWLETNRGLSSAGNANLFPGAPAVASPAVTHFDNVRAFGWRVDQPSINQRVANEAAAVTDYVDTKLR